MSSETPTLWASPNPPVSPVSPLSPTTAQYTTAATSQPPLVSPLEPPRFHTFSSQPFDYLSSPVAPTFLETRPPTQEKMEYAGKEAKKGPHTPKQGQKKGLSISCCECFKWYFDYWTMCPGVCIWGERGHLISENPVEYSMRLFRSQMNCVYIDDLARCIFVQQLEHCARYQGRLGFGTFLTWKEKLHFVNGLENASLLLFTSFIWACYSRWTPNQL
jgi:hypothetical protein